MSFREGNFEGAMMTHLIIGLLIMVMFILAFLLFWIIVLSAALLFFGRKRAFNQEHFFGTPKSS